MQSKIESRQLPAIPEHYLYWTYQNPALLRPVLRDEEGREVLILEAGERNLDDGPDFLDALLQIDGVQMRGDVEFHLRWQDWFRHGHPHDSRYRRVILHVLWYPPRSVLPRTLRERFAHLVLSRQLNLPLSNWLREMHRLEAVFPGACGRGACSFSGGDRSLRKLAWMRFQRKTEQLRSWIKVYGWETALYLGLARALGYRKNSAPFQELIRQLPPRQLLEMVHPLQRSPLVFWIILGLQAGLFNRPFTIRGQEPPRTLLTTIERIREQFNNHLPHRPQQLTQWHFARLRPQNNPYFRLAGFAQILFHYQTASLFQTLLRLFYQRQKIDPLLRKLEKALCLPLSPVFQPFLKELLSFRQLPRFSLGQKRCRQFVLNIVLPLFYLWGNYRESYGFQQYVEDLFFRFPSLEETRLLQPLEKQFSGRLVWAYQEQGMLESVYLNQPVLLPPQ